MKEGFPKQIETPNKGWFLREVIEKPFRIVGTIGVVVGLVGLIGTYVEQYPKLQETKPSRFHTSTPEEIRDLSLMALGTLVLVFSERDGDTKDKPSN